MISEEGIRAVKEINKEYSRSYIIEKDQDFTEAVARLKRSRVNLNVPIVPIVPITKERAAQKAIL